MTKLVPVVVLLEEDYSTLLQTWAGHDEIQEIVDNLGDIAARNGWNAEMLLGGMLLRDALQQELRNV